MGQRRQSCRPSILDAHPPPCCPSPPLRPLSGCFGSSPQRRLHGDAKSWDRPSSTSSVSMRMPLCPGTGRLYVLPQDSRAAKGGLGCRRRFIGKSCLRRLSRAPSEPSAKVGERQAGVRASSRDAQDTGSTGDQTAGRRSGWRLLSCWRMRPKRRNPPARRHDTIGSAISGPAPIYLQNCPGKYLVRNQGSHDSHHKIYPFPW